MLSDEPDMALWVARAISAVSPSEADAARAAAAALADAPCAITVEEMSRGCAIAAELMALDMAEAALSDQRCGSISPTLFRSKGVDW